VIHSPDLQQKLVGLIAGLREMKFLDEAMNLPPFLEERKK
jgi:hypothetical protein